ncbi:MAG: TetR/AcrR family transcriptional regulator [Anaerolineales bacterium]
MTSNKSDRRSQRTQQLLSEALVGLMLERAYDSITVQDIITRANVGRSTFYAHYQDKDALLVKNLERVMTLLIVPAQASRPALNCAPLFAHVQERRHLYHALSRGRGMDALQSQGLVLLSRQIETYLATFVGEGREPSVPLPIMAYQMASALLALLRWWLDHNMPHTPEAMDEMFQRLTMPGVEQALRGGQ